jgi:hypothetical protein
VNDGAWSGGSWSRCTGGAGRLDCMGGGVGGCGLQCVFTVGTVGWSVRGLRAVGEGGATCCVSGGGHNLHQLLYISSESKVEYLRQHFGRESHNT